MPPMNPALTPVTAGAGKYLLQTLEITRDSFCA